MITARSLILAVGALAVRLHAADVLLEDAAWGPLSSPTTGLFPREARPVEERDIGVFARALVVGGSDERILTGQRIHRDGPPIDAQGTVGLVDDSHGYGCNGNIFDHGDAYRRALYARAGSDPLARDAHEPVIAAGGLAYVAFMGAALSLHADGGWSRERGGIWYVEGAIPFPLPVHVIGEGDDHHAALRTGVCFRWAAGAIARTPDQPPWSFGLNLDWYTSQLRDHTDHQQTNGTMGELTLSCRVLNHWYVSAQAVAATASLDRVGGDARSVASGSIGVGTAW